MSVERWGPCICPPGHIGHMTACPAGYIKPMYLTNPSPPDEEEILDPYSDELFEKENGV
jgi:hypothetical protein